MNLLKKLFSLLTIIITILFVGIGTQSAFGIQSGYDLDKYGDASFEPIPEWIKQNAAWWIDGKISDTEFALSLEYLVKVRIISI